MNATLPIIWAVLLSFAMFPYMVLDGFDLGTGILFLSERDKATGTSWSHHDLAGGIAGRKSGVLADRRHRHAADHTHLYRLFVLGLCPQQGRTRPELSLSVTAVQPKTRTQSLERS
jgi:hypothetical protein